MSGSTYYNEIDPQAAQWLRNLIVEGVIAPGDVDERDIRDVKPVELLGYTQCHFFAGIGVWSYALRLAGWPDNRPVWTGSCPCGPFSPAGKGEGFADERHLWPSWHHHIRCCRPGVIFGEQVSNGLGLTWFDLVHPDLEGESYTVRPLDSCSAGVGSPHIRQRLWFMAYTESISVGSGFRDSESMLIRRRELGDHSFAGIMDQSFSARLERFSGHGNNEAGWSQSARHAATASETCLLEHTSRAGRKELRQRRNEPTRPSETSGAPRPGPTNGFWRAADWLRCRDDKWRPVEPGTFPLAYGITGRVGLLRGFGNAINPYNAAAVILAGAQELEAV